MVWKIGDLRWKFSRESHNGKGKCVRISCATKTYSNGLSITSSTLRSQWIHWISHITLTLSLCMYLSAHRTCCRLHTAAMRTALKHISERRTVVSSQFWFSRRRIWLADTEVLSIWNYKYCVKVEKITRNRVVWCECVSVSVSQFQLKIVWLCSTMKKNVFKHIHIVLQLMLTFFDDVYNVEFHWFCCAKILFCEFYWNWFDSWAGVGGWEEKKIEQNYMCDCVRSSNLVLQIKSFTSIVLSCRNDMKKTSLWIDPEIEIQSIWAGRLELNSQCATLSYQSNVNWHDGKVSILIKCLSVETFNFDFLSFMNCNR